MRCLKTENCVICGRQAKYWHGHVNGLDKYALGYSEKKIFAGFCNLHKGSGSENDDGYFGKYDSSRMGECIPLFNK